MVKKAELIKCLLSPSQNFKNINYETFNPFINNHFFNLKQYGTKP